MDMSVVCMYVYKCNYSLDLRELCTAVMSLVLGLCSSLALSPIAYITCALAGSYQYIIYLLLLNSEVIFI